MFFWPQCDTLQVSSIWRWPCCTVFAFWIWPCRRRWSLWTSSGKARTQCWCLHWNNFFRESVPKLEGLIILLILPGKSVQCSNLLLAFLFSGPFLKLLFIVLFWFVQKKSFRVICVLCRYLYHSNSNPEAAYEAAKILRHIANYPNIQHRLVGDFTHDQVYKSLPSSLKLACVEHCWINYNDNLCKCTINLYIN